MTLFDSVNVQGLAYGRPMLRNPSDTHLEKPANHLGGLIIKTAIVLLGTGAIAASGVVTMVGPAILITVPLAIAAGIFLAFRRSSWSWICFGYPLVFALISAWIGVKEIQGYETTGPFAVSLGLGLAGLGLIATGLWKVVPVRGKFGSPTTGILLR